MQQDTISRSLINRGDSAAGENARVQVVRQKPASESSSGVSLKPPEITFFLQVNTNEDAWEGSQGPDLFPFSFLNETRQVREKKSAILEKSLKEGIEREPSQLKTDWIIPVLMASAFIYIVLSKIPGNLFGGLINFITFRGTAGKYSAETEKIFRIQSTLMNLASFINISLFLYLAVKARGFESPLQGGIFLWPACLLVVIVSVTARHIITLITGMVSENEELFEGYLSVIYNFYRIVGFASFVLVVLMVYSGLLTPGVYLMTGLVFAILMIIIRLTRLYFLFVRHRASLLYLILYLCALEILPVAVLIKYGAGLVSG